MNTDPNQHDQHDDALEKILAAMRDAAPPEGLESRIAQRLQQHASAPPAAPFRWRDAFANSERTAEWWRGAITGAAAVLLLTAAFALAGHLQQPRPARSSSANNSTANRSIATDATPVANSPNGTPTSQNNAQPCAHPTLLRAASVVPSHTTNTLRAETRLDSNASSHPAPPLPLTAQERALIRLAQTADPKQLATLNPEEHAKLEAQDAAAFAKFFAPRTPLPAAAEGDAPANLPAAPQASPESHPKSDSAINPEAPSTEKLETN